jgi:hypothetical protein
MLTYFRQGTKVPKTLKPWAKADGIDVMEVLI